MARTRIKICGVTSPEQAIVAAEQGADAVGVVFASASPRCVDADRAWDIVCVLPPFVTAVGLFVDPTEQEYAATREACPFHYGQLHGDEDAALVEACGPELIKAIRYRRETIFEEIRRWNDVAAIDALLVDGGTGGTGERADWHHLAEAIDASDHPVILAGGLDPENVGEAIRTVRPWGVDVSSGVERERGVKDAKRIAAFCAAVRRADVELDG